MALQVPRAKRLAPASTAVILGTATVKFKAKPVTFAELSKAALEYSKAHKSDHRHGDSRMKLVLETLRNRPSDLITPQGLERWLADEADDNDWSPATVNRYKALFSLTFRIGVENGHLKYNPTRLVKRRREDNTRVRWFLPQEEKRLRTASLTDVVNHNSEGNLLPLRKCGSTSGVPLNDRKMAPITGESNHMLWHYVGPEVVHLRGAQSR